MAILRNLMLLDIMITKMLSKRLMYSVQLCSAGD